MEILELLWQMEHPPPIPGHKNYGRSLVRFSLKLAAVLLLSLSLLCFPNFVPAVHDLSVGIERFLGVQDEREASIKEILVIMERYRTDLAPVTREALAEAIYEEAGRYDYDPKLILAFISIESSFNNWVVSEQGAKGLMQIMPEVAQSLAEKMGIEWMGDRTLFNPFLNLKMGLYYFSQLMGDFRDIGTALTAYNYGPTRVKGFIERKEQLPLNYYHRVLKVYQTL